MLSTCPACLEQVKHEDNLFEVTCTSCKEKFNPFLSPSDVSGSENSFGTDSSAHETGGASEDASPDTGSGEISESIAIFQELRDFGENLLSPEASIEEGPPALPPSEPSASAAPKAKPATATAPLSVGNSGSDGVLVTGSALTNYQVETYFSPISLWSEVPSEGDNPLSAAFAALWDKAEGLGATAILGVHWALSPDGSRCLMSGTPIRGTKTT